MGLFDDTFNKTSIYNTLFLNVKSVLTYPTLQELKEKNLDLYNCWKDISKSKGGDFDIRYINGTGFDDQTNNYLEKIYQENAPYYHEFVKIIAITYAIVYSEDGNLKRSFKKIVDIDELNVINAFVDVLLEFSSEGVQSTPKYFPILCGHNIINWDIPLLMKKILYYRTNLNNKKIPLILQKSLTIKPWDSGIIDISTYWKFNGNGSNTSLSLISNYLNLKKTIEILSPVELSKYYWENINDKISNTLDYVALQSATQTNICIQILNEIRQL